MSIIYCCRLQQTKEAAQSRFGRSNGGFARSGNASQAVLRSLHMVCRSADPLASHSNVCWIGTYISLRCIQNFFDTTGSCATRSESCVRLNFKTCFRHSLTKLPGRSWPSSVVSRLDMSTAHQLHQLRPYVHTCTIVFFAGLRQDRISYCALLRVAK